MIFICACPEVLDPTDIPRFISSLWVKLVNAGYYYFEGGSLKTLFDKQAISPERFCYEASPILHDGVTQERREPRLLGFKLLDTRLMSDPTDEEIEQYEAIKGKKISTSNKNKKSVSIASIGQTERLNDLAWDAEIKLDNGMMTTPRLFKESGATSASCHDPFRIDKNPSAKIGLDKKGNPFVYDAATDITHFIGVTSEAAIEGELVDDSTIVEEEHDAFDVYDSTAGIDFMNAKYAVVMIGGKCLTMEVEAYNSALKCNQVEFFSRLNLAEFNKEKRVLIKKTYVNLVDYWSAHKNTVLHQIANKRDLICV